MPLDFLLAKKPLFATDKPLYGCKKFDRINTI